MLHREAEERDRERKLNHAPHNEKTAFVWSILKTHLSY